MWSNAAARQERDSRVHKKGADRSQTFPELWNGASGSLAGDFRIACGNCGLEEKLEFGNGIHTVRSGFVERGHHYVVDPAWYGAICGSERRRLNSAITEIGLNCVKAQSQSVRRWFSVLHSRL